MKLIIYIILITTLTTSSAIAMEFKVFFQTDLNLNIIVAQGEIQDGDASKFKAIQSKADRDEEDDIIVVLNSLGGSVPAAFELSKVFDEVGVYTLVPDGALCASACASILYTAGNRRNILEGGSLGFHTCYLSDGKTVAKSSFCNETIADHAISNGLDHASVSLFVDSYGPGDMAWVGPDVACTMLFGMCRKSLKKEFLDKELDQHMDFIVSMVDEFSNKTPSFNCAKASTFQERMICNSSDLASLDRQMVALYKEAIKDSTDKSSIRSEQKAWLKYSRNVCKSKECIAKSYDMRIEELNH